VDIANTGAGFNLQTLMTALGDATLAFHDRAGGVRLPVLQQPVTCVDYADN
jgi:hypothetical protein